MQYLKAVIFQLVCCHLLLESSFSRAFHILLVVIFIEKLCRYLTVDLIFVVISGCIVNTSLILWAPLLHHLDACEVGCLWM